VMEYFNVVCCNGGPKVTVVCCNGGPKVTVVCCNGGPKVTVPQIICVGVL